jgi:hypothetical protein
MDEYGLGQVGTEGNLVWGISGLKWRCAGCSFPRDFFRDLEQLGKSSSAQEVDPNSDWLLSAFTV